MFENYFKQHGKNAYIANHVVDYLLCEKCTQKEYRDILKIVEQRLLDKSIYEDLEYNQSPKKKSKLIPRNICASSKEVYK